MSYYSRVERLARPHARPQALDRVILLVPEPEPHDVQHVGGGRRCSRRAASAFLVLHRRVVVVDGYGDLGRRARPGTQSLTVLGGAGPDGSLLLDTQQCWFDSRYSLLSGTACELRLSCQTMSRGALGLPGVTAACNGRHARIACTGPMLLVLDARATTPGCRAPPCCRLIVGAPLLWPAARPAWILNRIPKGSKTKN